MPAIDKWAGCVFQEKQRDPRLRRIGYLFRTSITDAERRYDNIHREWLAVVQEKLIMKRYSKNSRFSATTEPGELKWIFKLAKCSRRFARSRLRLVVAEFEVVERAGIVHQVAGKIPRLCTTNGCEKSVHDEITVQCTVSYDDELFLIDLNVDAYFELENGFFLMYCQSTRRTYSYTSPPVSSKCRESIIFVH